MKKISVHYLLALLLLCSLFSCTEDSNTNTSIQNSDTSLEAKQLLNIAYGNDSSQVYDIYLPENRNLNTKVIILIHGGGWTSGDKTDMNSYKDITQEEFPEYAIVNINYRLASQGVSSFPNAT